MSNRFVTNLGFLLLIGLLAVLPESLCYAQTYTITTIAGGSNAAAGATPALKASLYGNDSGLAVDPSGNIYVSDTGGNVVRKITPSGGISVIAGDVTSSGPGFLWRRRTSRRRRAQ